MSAAPRVRPADRLKEVGEYYFSRKLEQIRQMRAAGIDVLNLGVGSPDQPPAQRVIAAGAAALQIPGYATCRSTPELRTAISDWYERTYRVKVDPDQQVLPLLGSKEGIFYLSLAFLNPGDEVLVPNPGYPAYASAARLIGATPRFYDLDPRTGWLPQLAELERTDLSRCKLMWINYPHMPTGASGSPALFEAIAAFGRAKGILICNDNPYSLVLNRGAPESLLRADPTLAACAELNSLSKAANMAGWRVGMLLAGKEVVDAVLQVKSNVDSGMFLAVQKAAIEALAPDDGWLADQNAEYAARRAIVDSLFDLLGFHRAPDQTGLFVWAKAPEAFPDVAAQLDQWLLSAHVFITPGMIFGSNGARYARISLCTPQPQLREAFGRLKQVV